jgi:haloalkane dehalogenase
MISSEFPYESRYKTVLGSKIHYIDEGSGDPVLFLHGNPTSSYLWRNIIPYVSPHARCIAPDLIGMGKSDKPNIDYGYDDTYKYLDAFIKAMDLKNVTLVIHDWGSGLGFHYAHLNQDNVRGIAFMEALYRPMKWEYIPAQVRFGMKLMRTPALNHFLVGRLNFFVKKMLPNATKRNLTHKEMEHYAAPYPDLASRKPVERWPMEIPINGSPAHTQKYVSEYHNWLKSSDIPKLCLYGNPGMLIPEQSARWIGENFPNTEVVNVGEGLHFIQEDQPDAIGNAIREWYLKLDN